MYGLFHWFVKITGWIPQLFAFRQKVYYEDKSVQSRRIKGKAIVVSNHHSVWDLGAHIFIFPSRSLRCLTAELMYRKNFVMTAILNGLGAIKVDRNTHDFSFMEKAEKVLDKNGVILAFPEARIPQPEEETPLPFKPSVVYMALHTGAPIIPVAINGSYFNKKPSRVLIGKPMDLRALYQSDLSEKENVENINRQLRQKIVELKNDLEKRIAAEKKEN